MRSLTSIFCSAPTKLSRFELICSVIIFGLLIGLLVSCGNSKKPTEPTEPPPVTRCYVSPTRLNFPYSENPFRNSFVIKNTGETVLSGHLRVRNEIPQGWRYFYIQSPLDYVLNRGDSVVVEISYVDFWNYQTLHYVEEGTIETGHSACADVYCTGR